MSIAKIEINNLLSFDKLIINDFKEINCIVGMNNAGKSNFLKLIQFYYSKLNNKRLLSPELNNNYTPYGTITITYNLKEIKNIVTTKRNKGKSDIYPAIFNTFFSDKSFLNLIKNMSNPNINSSTNNITEYKLTLYIHKNESIDWSTKDREVLKFIKYLYPFFYINTRNIDLHDWSYLWEMISQIKTYKTQKLDQNDFLTFIDKQMAKDSESNNSKYSDDIKKIESIIKKYDLNLSSYSFDEKIINLIKTGLDGHNFNFNGEEINIQSDGTNSSNYLQIFISLMMILSRREYIIPALYIDEPEIGLHPKKSEELIYNIYDIYKELSSRNSKKQYPHILLSTHSPNILKVIIKLFENKQQVLHFSKKVVPNTKNKIIFNTNVSRLKSTYTEKRFLNRFTDNEARLFFSNFILFVEGETELELFGHKKLSQYFPLLKKIDIYQTVDLTKIKNINPSYSKINIPYFILYDLDKFIKISDKNYEIINDNYNFCEKYKESLKMFPAKTNLGVKLPDYKIILKYLTNNFKYRFDYTSNNITIDSFTCSKLVIGRYQWKENNYKIYLEHLKNYLKHESIIIADTTIENSLINNVSVDIFVNWLLYELEENIQLKKDYQFKDSFKKLKKDKAKEKYNKELNYIYQCKYLKDVKLNRKMTTNYMKNKKYTTKKRTKYYKCSRNKINPLANVNVLFNKFFTYNNSTKKVDNNLHRFKIDYLNKVKIAYIKKVSLNLYKMKKSITRDEFIYLFVVFFNGKTECLKDRKFFNKNPNNDFNKNLVKIEKCFKSLEYFFGRKTSNWVTCFFDYYLSKKENDYITMYNKKEKEDKIISDFKSDFKDLYAIINHIRLKLVE